MNSTPQPPVIFLAFANEYRKPDGYLRHLTEEATKIQEALKRAEQTGRCQVILRSNATLDRILDIFQDDNYRDRIAIFHYGGHAEDYGLLLSEAGGQTTLANAAGLAAFLGQQKGLRLVFLNGCSTKPQVEGLLAANVPAVLATAQKINDEVAMRFAARFYQGLAGGASLEEAYHEAEGAIWAKPEWITPRGLYWSEIEEAEQNRRPWALHLKPEAEAAGGWRLFSRPQLSWQRGRVEFYDQNYLRLPPGYLERTELLAELKPALLQAPGQLALTSAIKMNALHGMGGIGKSVMARALCADAEVQAAFPDGTLWTTLGQQPSESDLKSKLSDWVRTLGGIISENNLSLDRLKNLLAEQLQERAYLLVVDDAWRAVDAALFNVGGPECCLLLTTRDAAVAERLGAIIQPVPPMTQAEAVALLEGETAGALAQTDPDLKRRIVERLGRLPLALRLAGDQLRRQPPETWLANFTAQKLRSRRRETVHDNLFDTLALSLADLAEEERRLYLSLAIFKEDEAIPQVAINHLWAELAGYAPEETTDLLHDLAFRTLLQLDPTSLLDFDPPLSSPSLRFTNHAPEITLHDLLRDFITTELGDSGRLTTHQALLSAYRQTQTGEGWPTAPDDGYLYDHLAYHLAQVADHDPVAAAELRELFANDRWLHARVPQSDYLYDSYLADLAFAAQQAHRLAHNQIETGRPLTALADLVHYALIRTSINSLAANYVPALVARAVETDLWSAERALSLASKIFDSKQRAEMTIGILSLSTLTSIQRKRIQAIGMEAALTVKYNWS